MLAVAAKLKSPIWGGVVDDRDFFKHQKEMLADLFSQAQAYTNLVIVTGYAGAFAIWNFISNKLTPATGLGVGLLLCVSLATYIAWEIYTMVQKHIALATLRKSVDDFGRYAAEVKGHKDRSQLLLRRLERYWPITMVVAVGSAALAVMMLISAFCHALILSFVPNLFSNGVAMDVMALFVVIGGMVAGLIGIASFRFEAGRSQRLGRKMYSKALQEELRTSINLFERLISQWGKEGYIAFRILDEIDFSRGAFLLDRSHLQLLDDGDIKLRINNYYRESAVTLQRLRSSQEDYYRVDGIAVTDEQKDEKERMLAQRKGWIEAGIEELQKHQVQADQIASQLFIRF